MPYHYVASTIDNRVVKGTISVSSESVAEETLERAGYRVLSLKPLRPKPNLEQLFPTFFGIKPDAVMGFSRHLATVLEAGIPLTTGLQLLQEQTPSAPMRRVIAGLIRELEGGSSFAQALAKYPHVFPDIYRHIVGAGERAGNLESALKQAVSYMGRGMAASQKAKMAMMYPAFLLIMAAGVVALLVVVALPPMLSLYAGLGAELPWTTRLLIAMGSFAVSYKIYLLGAGLALAVFIAWYLSRPAGRLMLDKGLLKLPVIGPLIIQSRMALFSRTVSVLLKSGLSLSQAMDIVYQTTGNRLLSQVLRDVQGSLAQGQRLSQAMAAHKLFPPILVQLVLVGEKTGTLDANLATLADFYDEEVNQKVNALISMVEPAMTAVIGLVVAFIALSFIMPIYSVMGSMK
ncbi:MAG: type II secretion system F family protein [Chloroflexota bacterium]|nr:type II secretion system F family protein [Chloroflexota bacterium]